MELDKRESTICIDYSSKSLVKFPEEILMCKNLRMLCLDNNELTTIPDIVFLSLNRLTWLDVRNNKLTSLSPKIGKCRYLETLLIQDNCIEKLPMELGLVENLKTLLLSGNPITYPSPQILELGICGIIQYLKGEYDTIGKNEKNLKVRKKRKSKSSKNVNTIEFASNISKKLKGPLKKRKTTISTRKRIVSQSAGVADESSGNKINPKESLMNECKLSELGTNDKPQNKDRGDSEPSPKIAPPTASASKKSLKNKKSKKILLKKPVTTVAKLVVPKRNSDRYLVRVNLKRSMLRAKERALKELWTNRLRILLERQASILQRRQTIEALKNWRSQVDKFHILNNKELTPPFDLDENYLKLPTRLEYQKASTTSFKQKPRTHSNNTRNPHKLQDFSTKIDDIIKSIKALDQLNNSTLITPAQEQKLLESEIKKVSAVTYPSNKIPQ
ncbi:leucine-rich repeat-containing protein 27-like [Chrysoperla carnea]|uniref:leucine-rich repeat-containing protein 27-like n=1 Tax=Chrysoperla carnea TaxID=189513 RepID=UPI001D07046C|nr:leucine-rich repeat-containing protein 27-like [Chrysoperla carnea]